MFGQVIASSKWRWISSNSQWTILQTHHASYVKTEYFHRDETIIIKVGIYQMKFLHEYMSNFIEQ